MGPDELIALLVRLASQPAPPVAGGVVARAPVPAGEDDDPDEDSDDDDDGDDDDGDDNSAPAKAAGKSAPESFDALDARRRCAEALELRGAHAEVQTLLSALVNFTGHEEPSLLPCLCKTCVSQAGWEAEVQGVAFHRTFVTSGTRVLYFWLADELSADRAEVKRAVAEALRTRLRRRGRRAAS